MYYTNDKGDIAKVIERDVQKNLVKIAVNDVFIDKWRKYSDFVKEFKRLGVER